MTAKEEHAQMYAYETADLVKRYKSCVVANKGLTLSIRQGEAFGLLGPNRARGAIRNALPAACPATPGTFWLAETLRPDWLQKHALQEQ